MVHFPDRPLVRVRTKTFIGEALASIRTNLSTTLAATMTVLIGMFLLGLFITLGTWMLSYTSDLKKQIVVNVYFDRDASASPMKVFVRTRTRGLSGK